MRVAIDPGHGMGSRRSGRYDCGATCQADGRRYEEAEVALAYGLTLKHLLIRQGQKVFMTRDRATDEAPLSRRAPRAAQAGCQCLVSLHLNSAAAAGSGVEVLYRDKAKDRPLAAALQKVLVAATGFRSRGVKQKRLTILRFPLGPAVLIELGFINNAKERAFLLDRSHRIAICRAVAKTISGSEAAARRP